MVRTMLLKERSNSVISVLTGAVVIGCVINGINCGTVTDSSSCIDHCGQLEFCDANLGLCSRCTEGVCQLYTIPTQCQQYCIDLDWATLTRRTTATITPPGGASENSCQGIYVLVALLVLSILFNIGLILIFIRKRKQIFSDDHCCSRRQDVELPQQQGTEEAQSLIRQDRNPGTNTHKCNGLHGIRHQGGRNSGTNTIISNGLDGTQHQDGRNSGTNTHMSNGLDVTQHQDDRNSGTNTLISNGLDVTPHPDDEHSGANAALSSRLPVSQYQRDRISGTHGLPVTQQQSGQSSSSEVNQSPDETAIKTEQGPSTIDLHP